ncbi:MAG: hypothetical protein ACR2K5_12070 [Pseudolabrys sp.]
MLGRLTVLARQRLATIKDRIASADFNTLETLTRVTNDSSHMRIFTNETPEHR